MQLSNKTHLLNYTRFIHFWFVSENDLSIVNPQANRIYDLGWGIWSQVWNWCDREVVVVAGEDSWTLTLVVVGWPVVTG